MGSHTCCQGLVLLLELINTANTRLQILRPNTDANVAREKAAGRIPSLLSSEPPPPPVVPLLAPQLFKQIQIEKIQIHFKII